MTTEIENETIVENEDGAPIENDEAVETELEASEEVKEIVEGEEEETDPEAWQLVEEEQEEEVKNDHVPLAVYMKKKEKLKSKHEQEIAKKDAEIEALRTQQKPETNIASGADYKTATTAFIPVPKEFDFDTPEEYEAAMQTYVAKVSAASIEKVERERSQREQQNRQAQQIEAAKDQHYERVDKLVKDSGIKPDIYLESEELFKSGLEAVAPGKGNALADKFIEIMGEGSEKVVYYLGRNKPARQKLQALMAEDPSGLKASVYLGSEKTRLSKPAKRVSKAPAPATNIKGDVNQSSSGAKFKRKYDEAHGKNDGDAAWKIKREAKKAGIDTKGWAKG